MANDLAGGAKDGLEKQEKLAVGKLEPRLVFVSHAHADRKLAEELRTLVEGAFSGVVRAFTSTDPAPTGGLMPGDEWYSAIHEKLRAAESVWVLATPTSVERPWVYWEAGVGKATCPGSVVVLRVGLKPEDVPSPLSNFQSYDGLVAEDGGVGELLGKVGNQIGMTVHSVLIDAIAKNWLQAAKNHKPETEGTPGPKLLPEQLNQFDALIARLEAAVDVVRTTPSRREADALAARRQGDRRTREEEERVRVADARQRRITGRGAYMFALPTFLEMLEHAPDDTEFTFVEIDRDGDAKLFARRGSERTHVYLHGGSLARLGLPADGSERTKSLIREILEARDERDQEE